MAGVHRIDPHEDEGDDDKMTVSEKLSMVALGFSVAALCMAVWAVAACR
jgi:hypothetical protein